MKHYRASLSAETNRWTVSERWLATMQGDDWPICNSVGFCLLGVWLHITLPRSESWLKVPLEWGFALADLGKFDRCAARLFTANSQWTVQTLAGASECRVSIRICVSVKAQTPIDLKMYWELHFCFLFPSRSFSLCLLSLVKQPQENNFFFLTKTETFSTRADVAQFVPV